MASSVPIRIKNTFAPQKPGTVILPQEVATTPLHQKLRPERTAVAVTAKSDITVINIYSNRMLNSPGFMARVFEIFRKHRIVIDLVSTSRSIFLALWTVRVDCWRWKKISVNWAR